MISAAVCNVKRGNSTHTHTHTPEHAGRYVQPRDMNQKLNGRTNVITAQIAWQRRGYVGVSAIFQRNMLWCVTALRLGATHATVQ